jgi:cytochrome P450
VKRLASPKAQGVLGHLPRWAGNPLELLDDGARIGNPFGLHLGVPAVVGFSPAWNQRVLTDLETFTSAASFSRMVPYLAGGVILMDAPEHKPRRQQLNPFFHAKVLEVYRDPMREAIMPTLPSGAFEALQWASHAVLEALNAAFFSGTFPRGLLQRFLAPLHEAFPAPFLPRPLLFNSVNAEIKKQLEHRKLEGGQDIAAHVLRYENPVEELRISLAAGYDTTAHALAWAAWHLAKEPAPISLAVKETLRLYPPGFIGSRRAATHVSLDNFEIHKNALVMYSPYLTHRHPDLWPNPLQWTPSRFENSPPAWGYLPFGGGERICLGMHLAHLIIETALEALFETTIEQVRGDPTPKPGLTLKPGAPLEMRRAAIRQWPSSRLYFEV